MSILTHVLCCLFGCGSWVTICGLWVELPLIVSQIPEGWYLPSYLSVLIQLANIGPLFVTLAYRLCPRKLNESALIYSIVSLGAVATFLLAFFWQETVVLAGAPRSVALFILTFLVSVVDCTSSVCFLPFMNRLPPIYFTSYYVGEGLSGLLPALVAMAQGVGMMHCVNATATAVARHGSGPNSTGFAQIPDVPPVNPSTVLDPASDWLSNGTLVPGGEVDMDVGASMGLVAQYGDPNFSPEAFFMFLTAMMLVCLGSFLLLNYLPCVPCEPQATTKSPRGGKGLRANEAEQSHMIGSSGSKYPRRQRFGTGRYSWPEVVYIFVVLAWTCALTNSVLPSVLSYSCLPYGNVTYHWTATLTSVANPVACFIAMFFPRRSLILMGVLTFLGTSIGVYIMGMAILSPCPLFVNSLVGSILIVAAGVLFILVISYVKVMVALILRDEGHSALVWCGAVVQLGSMLGAFVMFPLVNIYDFFKEGDPCNTRCL